jgi:hypothetical protein
MRGPQPLETATRVTRSQRLGRSGLLLALPLALGSADAGPSQAQASGEAPTIEQLQRAIEQRDAVIMDLIARVEQLERSRATTPVGQPPVTEAGPAFPAPAAYAPLPEPAAGPPEPQDGLQTAQTSPPDTAPAAPGQFEVNEEAIERALERALVQTGALLLRPGAAEIEPSFSYVRRESDAAGPVIPGEPVARTIVRRQNAIEAGLTLRLGLPFDSQLEVGVPYAYEDITTATRLGFFPVTEQGQDGHGLGDVRVSLAKGLLREQGWRPNLIGRVTWDSRTGQTDDSVVLGSGFHEITGSLTATKRQDPLVFVGGLSYTGVLERNNVDPGDQFGFSLGTLLAVSPETSLRFFLNQTFAGTTELAGQTLSGSDQVSTSLVLGASSVLTPRILLDVTAGIGLTEDAPGYSISVSLPIRFDLPLRF